jgi:hypothetical protein
MTAAACADERDAPEEDKDLPRCLECGKPIRPEEGWLRFRAGDIHSDCFGEIPPPPPGA